MRNHLYLKILILFSWLIPNLMIGIQPAKSCRAFAVGSKFRVDKAIDYETFASWVDSLMQECEKNFTADKPNLVVFGELFGMVTPLFGEKMLKARKAKTLEEAFTIGAEVYLGRFIYHKLSNFWFGISNERALLLSFTDNFYTPFFKLFPEMAKKYRCYLIAGTLSADIKGTGPGLIAELMGYGEVQNFPRGKEVYNIAGFWDPNGELIGITKKVYLTPTEIELDFSPGKLEDVEVYDTPFGKVGIAISLDAFTDKYVRWLDDRGCQIIVQPDANNHSWADYQSSGIWQPKEWMWSTFGSIQHEYRNIQYNICPMIVGNLFDMVFDGQSSITAKSAEYPAEAYVGVDLNRPDPYYHGRYRGKFLAKAKWVIEGGPTDRELLQETANSLKPGGERENQYHEEIIWADLHVKP